MILIEQRKYIISERNTKIYYYLTLNLLIICFANWFKVYYLEIIQKNG